MRLTATEVKAGDMKAWCLKYDGDRVWTGDAQNVVYEALDGGEKPLFTLEQIAGMQDGEAISASDWSVECRMVDPDWLNNLPEHDGW